MPVLDWFSPDSSRRGRRRISDGYHLDRGYPGLVDQLRSLGADVSREEDPLLFPLD